MWVGFAVSRQRVGFATITPTSASNHPSMSCRVASCSAGRFIAMDCEMVGVGPEGRESAVARVSLVNFHGNVLLDTFVVPREAVTDYRTKWSGVRASDLRPSNGARPALEVMKQVAAMLEGHVLVGHALDNDLRALLLTHPASMTRDTAYYKPFRSLSSGRTPSLRTLAQTVLGMDIQHGEHNSVEDAQAAMLLYRRVKKDWEASLVSRQRGRVQKKAPRTVQPGA